MVKYGKNESLTEERDLGSSSSSSSTSSARSSDSEYYSPEEIVGKIVKSNKVRRSPNMKHSKAQVMRNHGVSSTSNVAVSVSRSIQNNSISDLDLDDYNAAIERNEQLEKVVAELNYERQQTLQIFVDEVKSMLGDTKDYTKATTHEVDISAWMNEVKNEATALKLQLESAHKENKEKEMHIQECNANMTRLSDERVQLQSKIDELEKLPQAKCDTGIDNKEMHVLESRVQELVSQVDNLLCQNQELEEAIISCRSDNEVKHLNSQIDELVARVDDLQNSNKQMEEEIAHYKSDNKARHLLESRIEQLVAQADDLQDRNKTLEKETISFKSYKDLMESRKEEVARKVSELRSQNKKLEEELVFVKIERARFMDQVTIVQQEMESLNRQKRELMEQINDIQVERLQGDMSRSREADERRVSESHAIIKDLELQMDSLRKQKCELEAMLKQSSEESCRSKEKLKELENKVYELERTAIQRGDCVSELERETNILSTKLAIRDEEYNSLESQKVQLELKITRDREDEIEFSKNKSSTKEREEKATNGISNKDFDKIKGWFKGSKPSLKVIERKMEDLVEEFRKNIEDNIRIMSQRIRVTEQLHVENKESYKIAKERLEQENMTLKARTTEYSQIVSTLDKTMMKLQNVAEATNNTLLALDLVSKHFDERSQVMMHRMSKFSEELRCVKNWVVGTKKANDLLKLEMGGLAEQLQKKEENESLLRNTFWKMLDGKIDDKVENVSLTKVVELLEQKMGGLEKLVKEKDADVLDICEEKREAIRQLCVLIDYQKDRTDHFKQLILQMHDVVSPRKVNI